MNRLADIDEACVISDTIRSEIHGTKQMWSMPCEYYSRSIELSNSFRPKVQIRNLSNCLEKNGCSAITLCSTLTTPSRKSKQTYGGMATNYLNVFEQQFTPKRLARINCSLLFV